MLFTHEEAKGQQLSVYFPQGTSSSTNFRRFSSPHKGSVSRLICWCFCIPGIARMAGRWVGTERRPVEWEVHRKGRKGCVSFLWELRPARPCQQLFVLRHRDDRTNAWVTLARDLVHPAVGGVRQLSLFKPVQLIQPSLESLLTPWAGGWGRRCKGQLLTCTTGLKFSGLEMLNTHQQILSIDLTGTLDSTNSS